MGQLIVKLADDCYVEWSSVVDSPITFGMSRSELEAYHLAEYGRNGHRDFEQRMSRVERTGTSSHRPMTVADVVAGNRAGPDETELSLEEVVRAYCLQRPIRDGWTVPVVEEETTG